MALSGDQSWCSQAWRIRFAKNITEKSFVEHKHRNITRVTRIFIHDDVIKWKHFPRYWSFERGIYRSPPHKGQWRGGLMFTSICAWTNGWQTNEAPVIWDTIALIMTSL